MTITPQGQLYLCKTPLENDYKNQLTFASASDQFTYFNSTIAFNLGSDSYTYIKKDNSIKVGKNIDEIIDCNYLFYKNTGFTTKYYFCFITNMEYVNENCTIITFETDCFQTWYFDIDYKACFVEREHTNNDNAKGEMVPENLETGEYVVYNQTSSQIGSGVPCIATTYDLANNKSAGSFINKIFQGVDYYVFKGTDYGNLYDASTQHIDGFLEKYAQAGKSDAITSMFMIPKTMIDYDNITWDTFPDSEIKYKKLTDIHTTFTFPDVDILVDYEKIHNITPKNKKLLHFPYRYFMVSNNNGTNVILREEFFFEVIQHYIRFKIYGDITPGCSIKMVPQKYKGVEYNYEEGINAGKFPICSWNTDVYTNWLTQNAVNIGLNIVGGVANVGMGAMLMGTKHADPSQIANGVGQITSTLGQIYQHSLIPPQVEGNVNCGDVTYSLGKCEFTIYEMGITNEFIQIIDDYFSMYGYKTDLVKLPNITGRTNWNFVKTVDCNFDGDIPQTDLNIIKSMFNNGVTLWHNPTTFLDYSQDNSIVTPSNN